MPTLNELIPERQHRTLNRRGGQIAVNLLALNGGKPYIDARLSRFPAESTLAWGGSQSEVYKNKFPPLTGSSYGNKTGRRERAYNVNHLARIIGKINQYVFATAPQRDGIDEEFARDVTLSQMGINRYWRRVSSMMTAARWCWVWVDAPEPPVDEQGVPIVLSVAQKREVGIRPYWSIYTPNEVVDWAMDGQGRLLWALTEHCEYANADPEVEATESRFRVLWERGRVRKFILDDDGKAVDRVVEAANPPAMVPGVLVGEIDDCPHWVDDAELMQRAILDLSSANHEALYKQVYAQLVMPEGSVDAGKQALNNESGSQVLDMIVGAAHPILETAEEKGISRYLTPTAADLAILRADINNVKTDLFDFVGMSLKPDSRQVESAEAKAWDHLDVAAFLRQQSQDLQEAETRLIALTREIDPAFNEYEPEYADDFEVGDFESEVKAYIGLANLPMPTEAGKEISLGALRKARARGFLKLDDEAWEALEASFEGFEVEDLSGLMPGNAAPVDGGANDE